MALKMTKFGGSSVADANQFKKVKAIVEADSSRQFVVPSAPGKRYPGDDKITDLLYLTYAQFTEGVEEYENTFARIAERYLSIERELGLGTNIQSELNGILRNLELGASEDYIVSRGEYLCAILMADYLGFRFADASELICFHADGTYDDETTSIWSASLEKERKLVIPGFYGRRRDGSIKTFSRGGSDITGAIIARAVHADVYENWTDVSGFMMADPRIVKNPKIIGTVSYSELRELAYMGASVLHEDSIFPVRRAKIPINVRNTNDPNAPGTLVVPDEYIRYYPREGILTGVTGRKGFTAINVYKDNMHNETGFGYRLLRVLDRYQISFEHIPSGIDSMSVVVADTNLRGQLELVLRDIRNDTQPERVELKSGLALVTAVGNGMVGSRGTAAKVFSALEKAEINIVLIDQGSSEMNIIVGIEEADFERAIEAIYRAFE